RDSSTPPIAPATMPPIPITAPSRRTRTSRCVGVEPIANRTPNSRVRALTENASTPATPTIAMRSATPANPPNTSALTRVGASTSARMSSSGPAPPPRRAAAQLANPFRRGRPQPMRVHRRGDEEPPAAHLLPDRVIHRHRRLGHQVLVVHVGHDADDPAGVGADANELRDRIGP